jgi:hypothetical protein
MIRLFSSLVNNKSPHIQAHWQVIWRKGSTFQAQNNSNNTTSDGVNGLE